jgi:hypothetical protein
MNITDPKINPPAFPRPLSEGGTASQTGMSLRDWFAGHALRALVERDGSLELTALRAYLFADAMLATRHDDLTHPRQ